MFPPLSTITTEETEKLNYIGLDPCVARFLLQGTTPVADFWRGVGLMLGDCWEISVKHQRPQNVHVLGGCWGIVGRLLGDSLAGLERTKTYTKAHPCWNVIGGLLGDCWEIVGRLLGDCWEIVVTCFRRLQTARQKYVFS